MAALKQNGESQHVVKLYSNLQKEAVEPYIKSVEQFVVTFR